MPQVYPYISVQDEIMKTNMWGEWLDGLKITCSWIKINCCILSFTPLWLCWIKTQVCCACNWKAASERSLIVRIGHCPSFQIGSHNTLFSISGSTDLVVFHQWPHPAHSLVMAQYPGIALYVIAAGWKVKMVDVRKKKSYRACKAAVEVYAPLPLLPHWAVSSKTRREAELKAS